MIVNAREKGKLKKINFIFCNWNVKFNRIEYEYDFDPKIICQVLISLLNAQLLRISLLRSLIMALFYLGLMLALQYELWWTIAKVMA